MNFFMYIPFFLFIIGAFVYYQKKERKKELLFKEKRQQFVLEHPDLSVEQSENLSSGLPWIGMDSSTLTSLFGEPVKKRILDQSMTRFIWSYPNLFIYLYEDNVAEWKNRSTAK
ncbi:MAG: hypothetical protein PF518_17185 [Spirochaetaceae bacterium]|jgi:hypothetical protein|nr:hypothetical protein [Spirochaetaceae bacterium]